MSIQPNGLPTTLCSKFLWSNLDIYCLVYFPGCQCSCTEASVLGENSTQGKQVHPKCQVYPGADFTKELKLSPFIGYVRDLNLRLWS